MALMCLVVREGVLCIRGDVLRDFLFFFSSRRRHTRLVSDWSSDVCSSDLGRPGGVYLDLPAKLFPQTIDAEAGRKSLIRVVDPAPRQIPAADAVQRALELLKSAKRPLKIGRASWRERKDNYGMARRNDSR